MKKIRVNLTSLSKKTGYSISHLSRVVRRETSPSVNCLEQMGKALGLNMHLLYKAIKDGKLGAWKNN
jgi:DNA-binding phage protein